MKEMADLTFAENFRLINMINFTRPSLVAHEIKPDFIVKNVRHNLMVEQKVIKNFF